MDIHVILGWLVHLYTATGALWGILALGAIANHDPKTAMLWMILATFVDSTDGFMARALEVRKRIPYLDGRRLDDIVDYFTYVVVPVAFLAHLGYIHSHAWVLACPLMASGLGFSNDQAKTDDDFFLGFPSYWNIVALYLWLMDWGVTINTAIILGLSVMVLVPTRYLYPSKTKPLKMWTIAGCILWTLQLLAGMLYSMPSWWMPSSIWYPAYYMLASWILHFTASAPPKR